jgi:GGDEF domain-containing protein
LLQSALSCVEKQLIRKPLKLSAKLLEWGTGAESAAVVERLRGHVERSDWGRLAPGLAITFSAGVVSLRSGESFGEAVLRADLALYEAKRQGRNRVLPRAAGADESGAVGSGPGAS